MATDRASNAALNQARVASNVDIANPATLANQLDQRHIMIPAVMIAVLPASVTYRYTGWVADRNYKLISARFISPMTITFIPTATTNVSPAVNIVTNADVAGGGVAATADTLIAQLLINLTTVATYASVAMTVQATNTIASGQRVDMLLYTAGTFNAPTAATGCPYLVDLLVQEV